MFSKIFPYGEMKPCGSNHAFASIGKTNKT